MTTNKSEVNAALESKNYQSAFDHLLEYGAHDFVDSNVSEKLFKDKESLRFFFNEYSNWAICLEMLSKESRLDDILCIYFLNYRDSSSVFEAFVANKYPGEFIKAIRCNEVYLYPQRLSNILNFDFGEKLNLHKEVWKELQNQEAQLWAQVVEYHNNCKEYSLQEWLISLVLWIESVRSGDIDNPILANELVEVYSLFVEFLLGSKVGESNFSEEEFSKKFIELISEGSQFNPEVSWHCFYAIRSWTRFKNRVLDVYSFQTTSQPILDDGTLYVKDGPDTYYKWKVTDLRMAFNHIRYAILGHELLEFQKDTEGLKIPGKSETDIQINENNLVSVFSTVAQLDDLCISGLKSVSIDMFTLVNSLTSHSTNAFTRYEGAYRHYLKLFPSPIEAIQNLVFEYELEGLSVFPFQYLSKSDFIELYLNANESINPNEIDEIIKTFGWAINSKAKFDRFRYKYDLKLHPFIVLGDYMFIPTAFLAYANWVFTLSERSMKEDHKAKEHSNSSECFEKRVEDAFKSKGFTIEMFKEKYRKGDADVIVCDETTLLLIQVKRTKAHTTLRDRYLEYLNVDRKAAKQLNDAEKYLFETGKVGSRKVHKWIVTNSFERTGEDFSGCLKLNYFDVLSILSGFKNEVSLSKVIATLESERLLFDVTDSLFKGLEGLGEEYIQNLRNQLLIAPYESKAYKIPISHTDLAAKAVESYNMAYDNYKMGNLDLALMYYTECLKLKPNDGEVYGSIANLFADIQIDTEAKSSFEKALALLPNDTLILRNWAIFLLESGDFGKGLRAVIILSTLYPMINIYPLQPDKLFNEALNSGLLSEKEILEFEPQIKKLNIGNPIY